tara:strand:- start:1109 stop:1717 length:609 start_codon:yes stop_codon:yes gene_type:complete
MRKNTNILVLASKSQSRKALLKKINVRFVSIDPRVDEKKYKLHFYKKKYNTRKITKELAEIKSLKISKIYKKRYVLGCDTSIEINKKTINKARNLFEAKKTLKKLSGKKHFIYTSMCISKEGKIIWEHTERTKMYIRKISNKEIQSYLKKTGKKILNSVGCYHAESNGPIIFKKIEGDFYNVLGLPVLTLISFLKKQKSIVI